MRKIVLVTMLCLSLGCTNKNKSEQTLSKTDQVKYEQYYVRGQELYTLHCSNCHQNNGEGLGKLFPPIKSSDYMTQNFEQVICLIKNGISEPIIVNEVNYNQPMPGVSELTDLEVAEIATYIYNIWEHDRGYIDVKQISSVLQKCDSIQE